MKLTREQKKFAYGRYVFYDNVKSILDFMDPVSKFDEEIEEIKANSQTNYSVICIVASAFILLICSIYSDIIIEATELDTNDFYYILYALCMVLIAVSYYMYNKFFKNTLKYDVDNDLNNFVVPFLQRIEKYVDKNTQIKLVTDLGLKLKSKYKVKTGTYDDRLIIPWFSAELPFKDDFRVFVDLTYVINCFGKLESLRTADSLKDYKMKVNLRFVFPKTHLFTRFDRINNYMLEWEETPKDYCLNVKTLEDCKIEFYRTIDGVLGLLFDNDICNNIIDQVYAKVTGFNAFIDKDANDDTDDSYIGGSKEDELIFLRKLLESKEKEINELKEKINELYSESIEISVVSDESNVEEAKETTEINETTVDTENGC